jgi:hypothetical protein
VDTSTTPTPVAPAPDAPVAHGTQQVIDGRLRVYYHGYWIKAYAAPEDTLSAKKRLIEALTHRLFNHVEHGLNVPGTRLEEARAVFDAETDPQRKRIKGAMLAGAVFNRATDIFTKLVEIQALGVEIQPDNALMRECGEHLQEALVLGKSVLHRSGEEGIDELWGEPLKAFLFPIEEFYQSRYIKIAQTMRDIDRIYTVVSSVFGGVPMFAGVEPVLRDFTRAAKVKSETLRTDSDIFDVWTDFALCAENLARYEPTLPVAASPTQRQLASQGIQILRAGKDLVSDITRARVPMPKSTREFIERCERYRSLCANTPTPDRGMI